MTMTRWGRGDRAVVAVDAVVAVVADRSVIAVYRRNNIDGCWWGAVGG